MNEDLPPPVREGRRRPAARKADRRWHAVVLTFSIAALGAAPVVAITLEQRVKAAFLYNFTKFVEWPAAAFPAKTTPFALCVVEADALAEELARIMETRAVHGRPVQVRSLAAEQPAPTCHVLFISAAAQRHAATLLAAVQAGPTLSVGEGNEFIKLGGCIRFLLEEGRVRFEVNPAATDRAGLKVSSKMLRLGQPRGSWR